MLFVYEHFLSRMITVRLRILALAVLCAITTPAFSLPISISYSQALRTEDPPALKGYKISLFYQPRFLVWQTNRIYIDGSFSHWWLNNVPHDSCLSIFAIAPVFRHYLLQGKWISPFINLSIGLSWLTRTRLYEHDLGIHFAFQDQIGLGFSFGPQKHFSITASMLHYSNASMASSNGGITAPFMLSAEYRFD